MIPNINNDMPTPKRTRSEESKKKIFKPDHSMIDNTTNKRSKKHTIPDHLMIPYICNDTPIPKRTSEDKAKSPNYYHDCDQTCKVWDRFGF